MGYFDVIYCNNPANTDKYLWLPIEPGTYYLRIDNFYCYFTFIDPDCNQGLGSPDVTIKYTYGQFTLLNTTWAVDSISQTYPWNEIDAKFQQLKSDGVTPVGEVALGQGSSFSQRYNAPKDFYIDKNTNYLFHADTNVFSSQKYYNWQDTYDVKNFRVKNSGNSNFDIISNYNPIYSSITIKNCFLESTSTNAGNIYFKDPWLIDYKDPNYGNNRRNRGMDDAVFVSRSSPFYPDTRRYGGDTYNGIFLSQDPAQTPNYYSVQAPQSVDFGETLGTRNVSLQNWSADPTNNASFEDANAFETGVVFNSSSSTTIKANLKVSRMSDNASTYSNNSQRKFVKTDNGWLHMVYESMGHVWLEHSSDGGITWYIGNGGQPLDNGGGKSPSIAEYGTSSNGYEIAVVFQEGTNIKLKSFCFIGNNPYTNGPTITISSGEQYTTDINPNITWHSSGTFMVTWERKTGTPGISYATGYLNGLNSNLCNSYGHISGTNSNSIYATISTDKNDQNIYFDVAWEQSDLNSIELCRLNYTSCGNVSQYPSTPLTVSESSSLTNYSPSIISYNGNTRVAWKGNFPRWTFKTIEIADPWNSTYTRYMQTYTRSPSLNKLNNNSEYYLAWSWGETSNGLLRFIRGNNPSQIKNFDILGGDIQICNGSSSSDIIGTAYSPFAAPYYFQKTASVGSIQKINPLAINSGMGCTISKNGMELYYCIGDIYVGNKKINFLKPKEKTNYNNIDTLNNTLITESFRLDDNTNFSFREYFDIGDSLDAVRVLDKNGFVSYKVELIDETTGKPIGLLKDIKLFSDKLIASKITSYNLNTNGINSKTARLKFTFNTNIDNSKFALIQQYADTSAIGKLLPPVELILEEVEVIKDYSLAQNYPNPFNPTTTITYQLPQDGIVSLKVYDLLGKEIATLVNEYKTSGRYNVVFNAGNLASGVYICQLKVNSNNGISPAYSATKKLLLLK